MEYNKHLSTTTKIENQYRLTYTPFRLKILNFIRECLQVSNLALTAMGMDRIILIAHLENKASIRVAEKSGFKLVSRFKGADRYTRTMRDYLRFEKEENCE